MTEGPNTGKQSVLAKLQTARIKLQEMKLKKSGHNKFAGYDYFELGDFLPAINQIFHDLGLCSIVTFANDVATLNIHDINGDGCVVIQSPMAEAQLKGCHPIQNLGATQTYLRRYLYVTALEIVEHDALDASEPVKESHSPTDGAYNALDAKTKKKVMEANHAIRAAWKKDDEWSCFEIADGFKGEARIALWELLRDESALRARIKELKAISELPPSSPQPNPLNA